MADNLDGAESAGLNEKKKCEDFIFTIPQSPELRIIVNNCDSSPKPHENEPIETRAILTDVNDYDDDEDDDDDDEIDSGNERQLSKANRSRSELKVSSAVII